jgi:hypothetical protein
MGPSYRPRTPLGAQQVEAVQDRLQDLQISAAAIESRYLLDAARFLNRHRDCGAFSTAETVDLQIVRMQRTLAGLARSLRQELPLEVRRAGEGKLIVSPNTEGARRVIAQWERDPLAKQLDVSLLADQAVQRFGECNPEAREGLLAAMMGELLAGTLPLPEFSMVECSEGRSQWAWKKSGV